MRLAFAIGFGLASLVVSLARADAPFEQVEMDGGPGYVIPIEYAKAHKAEIVASIPGHVTVEGFWTLTDTNVSIAERILRELLHKGEKDPAVLFPDLVTPTPDPASPDSLANQQKEIALVNQHYGAYTRQYVGIIIDGHKLVFCNYSDAPDVDAAREYIYLEKYFSAKGEVHFLQCRVDTRLKTWSNVSLIGPWQKEK